MFHLYHWITVVVEAVRPRLCRGICCVVNFTVLVRRTFPYLRFRSIFSFLPPSTTIRGYQRQSLSTTASEIGSVYCSIVSYATSPHMEDPQNVIQSLIAIRLKLKRSIVLRANVIYEVGSDLRKIFNFLLLQAEVALQFSLRGRWPAERYQKILEIQLYLHFLLLRILAYYSISREIAYLLSHLMSVLQHLEPAWTRAFLRRTRFLDPDFQGDVLAVISKGAANPLVYTLLRYVISVSYDINRSSHWCPVASNHTMPTA
jgi:hypothetical protein